MEPIGLVFVAFFGIIIFTQFTGMLFHRFGTLSHILAATELTGCSKEAEGGGGGKDLAVQREGVRLIRKFQKLKNLDGKLLFFTYNLQYLLYISFSLTNILISFIR